MNVSLIHLVVGEPTGTAMKCSTFEQELIFVKNQLCQIVVFEYCSNSVDNKSFDQKSAILIVKTDF